MHVLYVRSRIGKERRVMHVEAEKECPQRLRCCVRSTCRPASGSAHAECLGRVPAEGFSVEIHQLQEMDSPPTSWITLSRKSPVTRVCWGATPMVGRAGPARVFGA
ncbi:small ligand-binding sensory domain FIST [Streptomyces sp. TE3672]